LVTFIVLWWILVKHLIQITLQKEKTTPKLVKSSFWSWGVFEKGTKLICRNQMICFLSFIVKIKGYLKLERNSSLILYFEFSNITEVSLYFHYLSNPSSKYFLNSLLRTGVESKVSTIIFETFNVPLHWTIPNTPRTFKWSHLHLKISSL